MGPWNFCNQAIGSLAGQNRGGGAGRAAPAGSGDGGRRRRGGRRGIARGGRERRCGGSNRVGDSRTRLARGEQGRAAAVYASGGAPVSRGGGGQPCELH